MDEKPSFSGWATIEGLKTGDQRVIEHLCSVCKKPIENETSVCFILGASEMWHSECSEERHRRDLLVVYGPPDPNARQRDPYCVKAWPECETGMYDPRCCRFPKSCSCG